ncbi:MAG: Ig-like domain-containing protein, partial [Acidobacteriota bacterium]
VAKYGFAGPEDWVELDTSLNPNPADTMWALRMNVCLDAACSQTMNVFASHWYSAGGNKVASYDRQASQMAAFMQRAGGTAPHVLVGDLNVWEGTARACGENPTNIGLQRLRDAGYVDAWTLLHGSAEGFTGMTNRSGCGVPIGYGYKRPDYTWSLPNFAPLSIARFGVVPAGDEAPSDHYGLITEFPRPGAMPDTSAPSVTLVTPADGQHFEGGSLQISATASDDLGVARVDILEDGVVTETLTDAPYEISTALASIDGAHTVAARAYDAAGNMSSSAVHHIVVETPESGPVVTSPDGDTVLYAKNATIVGGKWSVVADTTAAGGARMWNPDAGVAKLAAALEAPASYFEQTFYAEAGQGYRLWLRGRADADAWTNDSVFVQFSGSTTDTGTAANRIGTAGAAVVSIEGCSACGLSAWGWQDNGYGVDGPLVYFAVSGTQTIRIQPREDGISLDQIVLSPEVFLTNAPGVAKQDAMILPMTVAGPGTSVPTSSPLPTANPKRALATPAPAETSAGGKS